MRSLRGALALLLATSTAFAWQGGSDLEPNVAGCVRNLKLIHEALFVYASEFRELPPSLSELVDSGVLDRRYLLCPEGRDRRANGVRRDELVNAVQGESKTWYKWEYQIDEGDLGWTNRQGKEKQRKIGAGGWVPLIRCDYHEGLESGATHINLGYGGGVYYSGDYWEFAVRDVIPVTYLVAKSLYNNDLDEIQSIWERMPKRHEEATSAFVDLGKVFNCLLDTPWIRNRTGEDANALLDGEDPPKLFMSGDIGFEVRGVVQLEGSNVGSTFSTGIDGPRFPRLMRPVGVDESARKLHFLCGVIGAVPDESVVARFRLVDRDGEAIERALKYGVDVAHGGGEALGENARIVWRRREIPEPDAFRGILNLSHVDWDLGRERRIVTISFEATEADCYPFVLAVTLE